MVKNKSVPRKFSLFHLLVLKTCINPTSSSDIRDHLGVSHANIKQYTQQLENFMLLKRYSKMPKNQIWITTAHGRNQLNIISRKLRVIMPKNKNIIKEKRNIDINKEIKARYKVEGDPGEPFLQFKKRILPEYKEKRA